MEFRVSGAQIIFLFVADSYFLTRLPVVEKRLAQSGIRLASTLNRIFASEVKVAEV